MYMPTRMRIRRLPRRCLEGPGLPPVDLGGLPDAAEVGFTERTADWMLGLLTCAVRGAREPTLRATSLDVTQFYLGREDPAGVQLFGFAGNSSRWGVFDFTAPLRMGSDSLSMRLAALKLPPQTWGHESLQGDTYSAMGLVTLRRSLSVYMRRDHRGESVVPLI